MSNPMPKTLEKVEKILLALDGSDSSSGALKASIYLSQLFNSKLYVISVAVEPKLEEILDVYPLEAAERVEHKVLEYLESIKKKLEEERIVCETIFRRGPEPYKYIIEEALKNDVNLIIMGRRGKTRFMKALMGSVTARTIGEAFCPVLVIPKDSELHLNKILLATDGSIYSMFAAYEAINLLKYSKGELTILSVAKREENMPAAEESVRIAKEVSERQGIKAETMVLIGEPFEVIVKTAKEKEAGLIVMGCYGKTGIEKLLMGSVTERVIGFTNKPVLVVRRLKKD